MPKLSISLTDRQYLLLQKEMEDQDSTNTSKTIGSMIEKASPYYVKVEITTKFISKEEK